MKRRVAVRVSWIALIVLAGMVVAARAPGPAQVTAADSTPAAIERAAEFVAVAAPEKGSETPSTTPDGKKAARASGAKKGAGRLPMYYAKVVDKEQRTKIVAIQDEYAAKIEPLQRQIDDLIKERDGKVAAVLTPEQQKRIDELKSAAQKARNAKKTTKENPASP
jgi:hypothetical protein